MKFIAVLTGVQLALVVGYIALWLMGRIEGNFPLLLLLATVVTGAYWIAEKIYFQPRRKRQADALVEQLAARQKALEAQGVAVEEIDIKSAARHVMRQPWWLDWTAGLFPVIAAVFVLRSFAYEPFRIPSGSMIPTLLVGDLILVDKFTYGLRMPVWNAKLTQGREPGRGEVMVFRYPPDPRKDYIKRVIGVPGDTVSYLNKKLTVNGQSVNTVPQPDYFDRDSMRHAKRWEETLGGRSYEVLNNPHVEPGLVPYESFKAFREDCDYSVEGVTCRVPKGHFFVMGDNRDNSADSRAWGFVPEENIVGRAVAVWMNLSDLGRIGKIQ
ncbi:signal peptidase I [Allofranklinella schreckenbergeri]|nr:signal peptidase I [Allofranklinella schreckenbergeri]